jgi:allantoate deiminase
MNLRLDAMAGAAEWITTVEQIAKVTPGLVATVGSVQTSPGSVNVIASQVRATLDVRHKEDGARLGGVSYLTGLAKAIARHRNLIVSCTTNLNQYAVMMDPFLTNQVEEAVRKAGCTPHRMVSGAGHDAMIVAEKVPSAMIFLRTPSGISHDPAESVAVEDVSKAIECGVHLLHQLSSSPKFKTRTCRV